MRFIKYFIADIFLCPLGWHESLGMIESVVVGIRYILNVTLLCSFVIAKSR
jgi:hypothetical protein